MGSFEHVQNFSDGQNGHRRPFDEQSLSVTIRFVRNSYVTSLYLSGFYPLMTGGITKWHNSCNTDPSVPIFSTKHALSNGYGVQKF